MTFRDLFDSVKAGKYAIIPASEKLTHSEIKKALVGVDKTALSVGIAMALNNQVCLALLSIFINGCTVHGHIHTRSDSHGS